MEQPPPVMTRERIFVVIFFSLFVFLVYQLARLVSPFASALIWAAVLALALYPPYKKMAALLKGRTSLAAGAMTLITLIVIIGPAIILLAVLGSQAVDLYQWASGLIQSGRLSEAWNAFFASTLGPLLSNPALADLDLKGFFVKSLGELSSDLASQIGGVLKNTALLTINIVIMLFSLFFFFRDGEAVYLSILDLLPFSPEQKNALTQKFVNTFSAVISGVFLIALLQGVMTGLGFTVFGLRFPVLWGFLSAALAILPIGGAALVWIPGALYLLLTGATLNGILLSVWGLLLISLPDNFLKPLLIGKKAKLPSFLLFLSILGGIKVYGLLGVLFGPIVVTLATAFVQIYREEYANK